MTDTSTAVGAAERGAHSRARSERMPVARTKTRHNWRGYLFIAPALLAFLMGLGIPLVQAGWISLWHWDGLTAATWAGFSNYVEIVKNTELIHSFGHSAVLVIFFAVLPIVIGLLLTAVMNHSARLKGIGFFRAILFLPQVIATVVVAATWLALYAPSGLINQLLRAIGLSSLAHTWLGGFGSALPSIGFVGTWANFGLCFVLFLAGAANIPRELYEAARLDGAGMVREFFAITLPSLRGQIAVAATLTTVSALKTFDLVYVTTQGGPGFSTTVPAYEVFKRAFVTNQVGSASAIGITLTILVLVVSLLIARIQPKEG